MAAVIVAAKACPVIGHDPSHRLAPDRQNVQPQQNRPKPVLLAHMIAASAKAFLTAQRHLARIQKVAKELPARRRLMASNSQSRRHPVHRRRGGHRPRHARQTLGIGRGQMCVGGQNGETVRGRDINPPPHHHVAIAISVARRAKIRSVFAHHLRHQRMGPCRIGVGMQPAKIGQGGGVDHGALGSTQTVLKNFNGIGPGDRIHRIHPHAKPALKEGANGGEVEKPFHQGGVIRHRIDYIDDHVAHFVLPYLG